MNIAKKRFAAPLEGERPEWCGTLFAVFSLFFLLWILYSNSFQGEWHFDDFHNIVNNRSVHLQGLSWSDVRETLCGTEDGSGNTHRTRPLSYISFGLNYFFGGTDVFGYHVVNFLIHFASAVFLYLFLYKTLRLPLLRDSYGERAHDIALLAAFLWASSPLQVNAVTIIVQRMTSLAGLFTIMALYVYVQARRSESRSGRWSFSLLCVLAGVAACGSKENAAMLPFSILLYDVLLIQGATRTNLLRLLKYAWIPLALILFTVFAVYEWLPGIFQAYEARPFTMAERLLTAPRILLFYITLLLYPIPSRLTLLHDIDFSRSLLEPWTTLPALLAVAILVAVAAVLARRKPLFSYCVLFFFLNHLIEGTVIPLELIFEHRNYIPSMLFFVPVAVLMIRCLDYFSYRRSFQVFMAGGLALLLSFQGYTTFERNDIVRSDTHLWLDNVEKSPRLSRPHINLARHYYEAGMYEQAYEELKVAEELNRDTNLQQIGLASQGLGLYYLYHKKDLDRAKRQFEKALERLPGFPAAVVGLATVDLAKGDIDKAWQLMKGYAPRHRHDPEITATYALVLLKKGDPQGALKAAAKVMALNWENPKPWEISGEAWRQLGQWRKAAQCWEEVLRMNPLHSRAYLALLEIFDHLKDSPALARIAVRCMALKGEEPLDTWLKDLAKNSSLSAYKVNPDLLGRIIRREIGKEMKRHERAP